MKKRLKKTRRENSGGKKRHGRFHGPDVPSPAGIDPKPLFTISSPQGEIPGHREANFLSPNAPAFQTRRDWRKPHTLKRRNSDKAWATPTLLAFPCYAVADATSRLPSPKLVSPSAKDQFAPHLELSR